MRVLLDQCLDERLRHSFTDHHCETARFAGFGGLSNGRLLAAAEAAEFDVLITIDQSIRHQQNMQGRKISLIIVCAATDRFEDTIPRIPAAWTPCAPSSPAKL